MTALVAVEASGVGGKQETTEYSAATPLLVDYQSAERFEGLPGQVQPHTTPVADSQKPVMLIKVRVRRSESVVNSLSCFVAERYREVPEVLAVYRQRYGDALCFHIVTSNDEEETLESAFRPEEFVYSRFSGEEIDFQVWPGSDLEACVPGDAALLWRR